MTTSFLDPGLWPRLHLLLIAHDVGGSRDRSTAVVGGFCGYARRYARQSRAVQRSRTTAQRMMGRPVQHGAGNAEIIVLPGQTFIDHPALAISGSRIDLIPVPIEVLGRRSELDHEIA